ncbi:hypothetical protein SAMN05216548_10843 [Faunimonas pinastri]|uniref:Uncharacterized protein n=1 Tax=Faunimonas pinastri TaxID=1855383 RepID=A0A1H9J935_9HYPH|nr:hypothetical protein [Faunimonas pinastri]SEQ83326.1 hypothetical protein SAMN05216548_10843 [Faunimonas pinastri]
MSAVDIGALVGFCFAAVEFVLFGIFLRRAKAREETGRGPRALNWLRWAQLVIYPVIGSLVGAAVTGKFGG